ncbi:uncharacterized protein LOC142236039 [Haematobia irritans]|uniref:uncharacterized protein LOC142236039 n=1 Tax=Haematobia irritans TaxID=7368 RepID=UPI003F4F6851
MEWHPLIAFLTIVNQVYCAGLYDRIKRNTTEDFVEMLSTYPIKLAAGSGAIVKSLLNEFPKTDAFNNYRLELETYLEAFKEYRNKEGPCLEKSKKLLGELNSTIGKYYKEDAPQEAKAIVDLFHRSDVYKELIDYEEKLKAFGIRDWSSSEMEDIDTKMSSKMTVVC